MIPRFTLSVFAITLVEAGMFFVVKSVKTQNLLAPKGGNIIRNYNAKTLRKTTL